MGTFDSWFDFCLNCFGLSSLGFVCLGVTVVGSIVDAYVVALMMWCLVFRYFGLGVMRLRCVGFCFKY